MRNRRALALSGCSMWFFLFTLLAICSPAETADTEGRERIAAASIAAGVGWPMPSPWVHIDKSERRLILCSGEHEVRRWVVALGGAPAGDKTRQGDQRTPTGHFRVVTRNPTSNYTLFLGLSYPDADDADRGLRDGLISDAQARSIRERDARDQPAWDTALGGAIGLHGGGAGGDWTLGCIALEDEAIEELWVVLRHGSRVVIEE